MGIVGIYMYVYEGGEKIEIKPSINFGKFPCKSPDKSLFPYSLCRIYYCFIWKNWEALHIQKNEGQKSVLIRFKSVPLKNLNYSQA